MKIKSITILLSNVMDKVFLETDLPSPCPRVSNQNTMLEFSATYDYGLEYVLENFPQFKKEDIKIISNR